jgi:ribonuclease HI
MPWLRHRLRDADVWAKVDANAALIKDSDGRVEIVYKPTSGARVYRAGARNLTRTPDNQLVDLEPGEPAEPRPAGALAGAPPTSPGGAPPPTASRRTGASPTSARAAASPTSARAAASDGAPRTSPRSRPRSQQTAAPADAIHIWTDGACSGNPGLAGLGVVIVGDGPGHREISEFLGQATNNIAELTAILRGLESVTDRTRTVIIYSDSAYSIGLLTQAWKPKKNIELVQQLRALARQFADLRFVKVAAHSGIPLNERVDQLAVAAIHRRGNTDRRV